ncbi:uncharacterized protein OsI_030282 [Sorghum bicolor]|jgi:hypothetical protein|uniref:Pollen allergen Poa p IX/Phl p VI domain-containing protein n=1 Tax=Sorghum bicolor TaxID=4558 RepID=C5Y406_SORBI|nr:uncharacterized protein OsI_030282 [Sorghum bicolor]EES07924.2 hypothetical protein SORBI_3005G023400 [Sorghum bicolor]OQU82810.1 hypothetical protein SORBI_3005G023400 [Sorghum bicolor]OQU82811.1 hypothetical protein SORBI_3005G023400 [Sorghum bicolor]|eukprot:XP_002448936.2 uncharacterized protein OsI_030282 [Sorghum bicolor]
MAGRKILLLLLLCAMDRVAVVVLAVAGQQGADPRALPAEWATAIKYKATMDVKTRQAFDGVVAAAPAEKRSEAVEAVLQQQLNMDVSLGKATASGDENNFVSVAGAYEKAADAVIAASPANKLGTMAFAFNGVVAPDPGRCTAAAAADKPFCETYAKTEKAFAGVIATGDSPRTRLGFTDVVLKQRLATDAAINKAYAEGDKDKIAKILAAYAQAADAVAAAAPPEKLRVMEQTFSAVAAAAHQPAAAAKA